MLDSPKHTASPVPGSQAGNCLLLFLQSQFILPSWLSVEGASLPSSVSKHMTPDPFQLSSHSALLSSPYLRSLFFRFWLKGRNGRGSIVLLLCPSEVEAGMALPGLVTSYGLKPLILTRFEAAGWQLVHVVREVPSTGALGEAQNR